MIARLRGRVVEKDPSGVVVDAGGVGYAVAVPLSSLEKISSPDVDLFIHTEVREDSIQLFGFLTKAEREVFRKLISVQGVGPTTALAILSGLSLESLVSAVACKDYRGLLGIPRVGRKTAERICLELSEKLSPAKLHVAGVTPASQDYSDTLSALENLGYRPQDAALALRKAQEAAPEGNSTLWLRLALKELTPK